MIESLDLLGFLTLGLLGGFGHCVGMCSPFVLLVARRFVAPDAPRRVAFGAQVAYTAGRVLTYAVLGAAAGALGGVVQLAGSLLGFQRAASVVAGGLLIVYGGSALLGLVPALAGQGGALFGRVVGLLKRRVPASPFVLGLFLGLLPCGLIYSALIAATAEGGAPRGALALTLFGLGTAPALLGLSLADELLARHRALVNRLSQVFVLGMGVWFVVSAFR
jgi:sulfite exporter TauE/SafE